MKGKISCVNKILFTLGAFGALLLVWQIAFFCVGNEWVLPAPAACLKECFVLLGKFSFWRNFSATLLRAFAAFLLSFLVGTGLAVVAYLLPAFKQFFAPIVAFFRALPTVAVVLLLLVFLSPDSAPVAVACLALMPMLYTSTLAAFLAVDNELIELCDVYKVSLKKRVFSLYLPTAGPYVIRECGAGLSFALKLVVSAEVLANTFQSIGGMMQESKLYLEIPTLFALTVCVVLFGFLIEALSGFFADRLQRRFK